MSTGKQYVGTVGVVFTVDCGVDISLSTDLKLMVKKPSGLVVIWTPTVFRTRFLRYITVTGDLDEAGIYYLQSSAKVGDWTWFGETASFEIFNIFE